MAEFKSMYWGIDLYSKKYLYHCSWLSGGSKPLKISHLVIDNPESVNLVRPPTIIIIAVKVIRLISQIEKRLEYFSFLNMDKSNI